MRFDGEWLECDDGIVRPVMRVEILAGDGAWRSAELLVDSGADRTVFRGNYAACTDREALDMSVLGRDLLEMFAVIVDRRAKLVTMIGGHHRYAIHRV
jgi:hypothetical protein